MNEAKKNAAAEPQELLDEKILERVKKVVAETLDRPEEEILLESRYVEDLGADSFDNLSLFMMLEEEFDQTISEASVEELTTVGSTVQFIRRLLSEEGATPGNAG